MPAADFDADGRSDMLFQNSTAEVAVWEMSGAAIIGGGSLGNPGPELAAHWRPAISTATAFPACCGRTATGEAVIWELNGANVIGSGSLGNPGPSWHAIGSGDFNGDGRSDILWQNSSGEIVIWELNGASVIASAGLGNPGPSWHAVAIGRFQQRRLLRHPVAE